MLRLGVMLSNLKLPLHEAIATAARLGAQGVQLWTAGGDLDPDEISSSLRREVMGQLAREGMEVSAICADYGRAYTDPANMEWLRSRIMDQVSLATAFATQVVTTHIGHIPNDPDSSEWKTAQAALKEFGDYAHSMGVVLATETGPEQPAVLRAFLDSVGSPGAKVNYDPANLAMNGFDPVRGVAELAPHIAHTHAKDGVRRPDGRGEEVPLGEGDVDWDAYIAALQEVRFDGYLTVEREGGEDPVGDVSHALSFLKMKVG